MLVRSGRILILEVLFDVVLNVQNVILGILNVILNVILDVIMDVVMDFILNIFILPRIELIEVVCCFYNRSVSAARITYRAADASGATVFEAVRLTHAV